MDRGCHGAEPGDTAHKQKLPDRVGAHQPLAERVVDGEEQNAEQHHHDTAGGTRRHGAEALGEATGAALHGFLEVYLPPSSAPPAAVAATVSWADGEARRVRGWGRALGEGLDALGGEAGRELFARSDTETRSAIWTPSCNGARPRAGAMPIPPMPSRT